MRTPWACWIAWQVRFPATVPADPATPPETLHHNMHSGLRAALRVLHPASCLVQALLVRECTPAATPDVMMLHVPGF